MQSWFGEVKCHLMTCCHLLGAGGLASHFQRSAFPPAFGTMHPSCQGCFPDPDLVFHHNRDSCIGSYLTSKNCEDQRSYLPESSLLGASTCSPQALRSSPQPSTAWRWLSGKVLKGVLGEPGVNRAAPSRSFSLLCGTLNTVAPLHPRNAFLPQHLPRPTPLVVFLLHPWLLLPSAARLHSPFLPRLSLPWRVPPRATCIPSAHKWLSGLCRQSKSHCLAPEDRLCLPHPHLVQSQPVTPSPPAILPSASLPLLTHCPKPDSGGWPPRAPLLMAEYTEQFSACHLRWFTRHSGTF